jgi:hypothetical protein
MYRVCLFILTFFFFGCSSGEDLYSDLDVTPDASSGKSSFSHLEPGALNAVKKAYQLTEVTFTPLSAIEANSRVYSEGGKYKGMIYSSVKEIGTYVGPNVSFHTFMTAIHNPRSKIYTERLNALPYHGTNCKAYYGTVCSILVSYALGIFYGSFDFPASELMEEVDCSNIDNVHVADVLWTSGHVALITNVLRNSEGHVKEIEICEAVQSGCRRYAVTSAKYSSLMSKSFKSIYRYKELYKNVDYTPAPEFVPVLDEVKAPFAYNDDLCPDKGDKTCYLEGENVVVYILQDYDFLLVLKDNEPYQQIDATTNKDVVLENLPYGDYKAAICKSQNKGMSDYVHWKVVNIELEPDRANSRLYFKSANAIPFHVHFASVSGQRKYPYTTLYSHSVTDEEKAQGYLEIPQELTKKGFPYVHFNFSTEYGKIEGKPLNWFEGLDR